MQFSLQDHDLRLSMLRTISMNFKNWRGFWCGVGAVARWDFRPHLISTKSRHHYVPINVSMSITTALCAVRGGFGFIKPDGPLRGDGLES
jgi:hypothetical protein